MPYSVNASKHGAPSLRQDGPEIRYGANSEGKELWIDGDSIVVVVDCLKKCADCTRTMLVLPNNSVTPRLRMITLLTFTRFRIATLGTCSAI